MPRKKSESIKGDNMNSNEKIRDKEAKPSIKSHRIIEWHRLERTLKII